MNIIYRITNKGNYLEFLGYGSVQISIPHSYGFQSHAISHL
jgi:hypothetical protein